MEAPPAEVPVVLEVPSEVDEGMCITREMVHRRGMSLSKQHTAGFTSFLLAQNDFTLSTYKQCSYLSM